MTNEQLTAYLQDDSYLYAVTYEELKTLVMQYPYATNLRILLLKKSFLEQNKDYERNLQMAATFTTNRKYLYQVVQKVKSFQAAPQSVILGEDYLELTELSNIEKLLAEKQVPDGFGINSKLDTLSADWQLEFGNLEGTDELKIKGRDAEEDEMFELAFQSQVADNQSIENNDDLDFLIGNIVSEFDTPPSVQTAVNTEKSDFEFVNNTDELVAQTEVNALLSDFEFATNPDKLVAKTEEHTLKSSFEFVTNPDKLVAKTEEYTLKSDVEFVNNTDGLVTKTEENALIFDFELANNTAGLITEIEHDTLDLSPISTSKTEETPNKKIIDFSDFLKDVEEEKIETPKKTTTPTPEMTDEEMDKLLSHSFKVLKKEEPDDLMANSFAVFRGHSTDELEDEMVYSFIDKKDLIGNKPPIIEAKTVELAKASAPIIEAKTSELSKTIAPIIEEKAVELPKPIAPIIKEKAVELPKPIAPINEEKTIEFVTPSFRVIKRETAKEIAAHTFPIVGKEAVKEDLKHIENKKIEEKTPPLPQEQTPQYVSGLGDNIPTVFDKKNDETTDMIAAKQKDLELDILNKNSVPIVETPTVDLPSEKLSFTEWLRQFRMNEAAAKAQVTTQEPTPTLPRLDIETSETIDYQLLDELDMGRKSNKQNLEAVFEAEDDVPESLYGLLDTKEKKVEKSQNILTDNEGIVARDENTEGYQNLIAQYLTTDLDEVPTEKKKKKKKKEMHALAARSLEEDADMMSETLADILVWQGKTAKAIDMYQKLSLVFPDKSSYFAAKIENIKSTPV